MWMSMESSVSYLASKTRYSVSEIVRHTMESEVFEVMVPEQDCTPSYALRNPPYHCE